MIGLVMLACFAAFLGAGRISRFLGVTGRAVSTRMLGIILAAMAVQFVIDGVDVDRADLLRTARRPG